MVSNPKVGRSHCSSSLAYLLLLRLRGLDGAMLLEVVYSVDVEGRLVLVVGSVLLVLWEVS